MEEIPISKFRATCLAVLRRVRATGKPVLVTRFGLPLTEIVPSQSQKRPKHWVGSLAHTGQILGDVVSPVSDEDD